MSNDIFSLQGRLDSSSEVLEGSSYKIQSVIGDPVPQDLESADYKIQSGSQLDKTLAGRTKPFLVRFSQQTIDFGMLSPTNPLIREQTIAVSTGSVTGYSLYAGLNKELTSKNGDIIPNTACDNGSCTKLLSAGWTNTLTYGFGYRCDNRKQHDCDSSFVKQSYFKPFPLLYRKEQFVPVMYGYHSALEKESTITYKLNVAGTQHVASYSATLTYIAVPNF